MRYSATVVCSRSDLSVANASIVFQVADTMSMSSLPAASERRNRTLVDHTRSRSTSSSSGDEHGPHRSSGYLQPLVSSASGTAGNPNKYLQLLNMSAAASTPQLAVRRHAGGGGRDREDRRRPDYSPLVCDGNDSSGMSLVADAQPDSRRPATACAPMRPGPSPLYGRHAVRERRVQSTDCDGPG